MSMWDTEGAMVARISPAAKTAGAAVYSSVVDMRYWAHVKFYVLLGNYAAGNDGTVTVKAQASNSATFASGNVDISGKALTVATFSGSAQDDNDGIIGIDAEDMTVSGTAYRYLRLSVTPANQNMTLGVVGAGFGCRYEPGTNYDLSTVAEIV